MQVWYLMQGQRWEDAETIRPTAPGHSEEDLRPSGPWNPPVQSLFCSLLKLPQQALSKPWGCSNLPTLLFPSHPSLQGLLLPPNWQSLCGPCLSCATYQTYPAPSYGLFLCESILTSQIEGKLMRWGLPFTSCCSMWDLAWRFRRLRKDRRSP